MELGDDAKGFGVVDMDSLTTLPCKLISDETLCSVIETTQFL